jgi:putative heme iron utilization protein
MTFEKSVSQLAGLGEKERSEVIRQAFERDRKQMVLLLALQFGVPEEEIVRAMPSELVEKLDLDRWEAMIRQFEDLGDVHVIVSNGAVTLENVGRLVSSVLPRVSSMFKPSL